ncbi:NEW3 domain-containing protein [Halorussus salilacus]|uniref:COG1361 S-layer family protein n=1 Tax=Halorussus salilacus TaxID=2953750 RepID=UPI00209E607B|nr:NEW3 domain-containing protein [Halorussus salilacus]USZ68396.1 NEW3 domain-containing protein [Halorussus salilacus]
MRPTVLLVVALVVAAGVGPALGQDGEGTVVGRPNIELSATENRFGPGERVTLDVFASNDGDLDRGGPSEYEQRVTTARNVRMEIDESRMDPELARGVEVRTGEVFAGTVPEGASGPFSFGLELSESLAPGTYQIPVEVTYDYTNFVRYAEGRAPEYGDGTRSQTAFVTVVVEDRPQFEVETRDLSRVTAGDTESYRLNVTNTGTRTATDAEVTLSTGNTSVFFGGGDRPSQRTSVFVGELGPGETQSFEVTVGASADTAPGTYLADAVVSYRNPNGVAERSDRLTFGVAVGGEQTFGLRNVDSSLQVGETGEVTGRVVNTGETNVDDAVVVLTTENPNFRLRETEYSVGDLSPGQSANFSFRVDTANATDPGPRRLDFSVEYRNPDGESRTSDPLGARVAVAREQAFDVRATDSSLQVGDRGTVSGTVVNGGDRPVSNAVVVLQAEGTALQPRETEYAVGDLDPGESADFDFEVDAPNDTDPGVRQVSFRVRYRNDADEIRYSDSFDSSVAVGGEQTFAVGSVGGDLRVGETGDLRGEVTNAGDRPVSNAVVVLRTGNPNLEPRETEYAVGDLDPGESADFEFAVDVNAGAEPGPRQVSVQVRYRNRDGDLRTSDDLDARVDVTAEVDEFLVEPVDATVAAGSSSVVEFRVTNAANATLRDVEAKLFASDPLSSDNDEAFVSRLEPNESATLKFAVSVAGGAIPKAYPVSMDFAYENERGDDVLSDTYRVPVEVTDPERRGWGLPADVPVAGLAALGAVALALGLGWWKRDAIARRFS